MPRRPSDRDHSYFTRERRLWSHGAGCLPFWRGAAPVPDGQRGVPKCHIASHRYPGLLTAYGGLTFPASTGARWEEGLGGMGPWRLDCTNRRTSMPRHDGVGRALSSFFLRAGDKEAAADEIGKVKVAVTLHRTSMRSASSRYAGETRTGQPPQQRMR